MAVSENIKKSPKSKKIVKRNVLLLVTGTTPQVVTETLFCLVQGKDKFIPNEMHFITTADGEKFLTTEKTPNGYTLEKYLNKLCNEYPDIFKNLTYSFASSDEYYSDKPSSSNCFIHIIKDSAGKPLKDIRTSNDSETAGNTITSVIKELCEDNDINLKVSIAGGRKTLGFYAGYALSIFSRNHNFSLHHVLANELFESKGKSLDKDNPPAQENEYFYPTQKEVEASKSAGEFILELATIPVLHIGGLVPKEFHKIHDYSTLIDRMQRKIDRYKLSFNLNLIKGKQEIILSNETNEIFRTSLEQKILTAFLTILSAYIRNGFTKFEPDIEDINNFIKIYHFLKEDNKGNRDGVIKKFNEVRDVHFVEEVDTDSGTSKILYHFDSEFSEDYIKKLLKKVIKLDEKDRTRLNVISAFCSEINGLFSSLYTKKLVDPNIGLLPDEVKVITIKYSHINNKSLNKRYKVYPYYFEYDYSKVTIDYDSLYGIIEDPKKKRA